MSWAGHILQEEESNGISKEQDIREVEGGRGARDARADWTTWTLTNALLEVAKACIICMVHMGGVWDLELKDDSPRNFAAIFRRRGFCIESLEACARTAINFDYCFAQCTNFHFSVYCYYSYYLYSTSPSFPS
jgi:hypothetical protein